MLAQTEKIVWRPQPGSQEQFLSCPIFECLYGGTRGPGKTDALIMDYLQHVGKGYGQSWRGILFRQTYKQLTDVIAKTKKWIPQIWPETVAKYNNTDHKWEWTSGEVLFLRQFAREDDYWNYHGHEYPWVGWEELCNWASPAGYRRMMSTSRSTHEGMPRKYRATANPYGPGHNWVAHRWRLVDVPKIGASPIIKDSVDADGNIEGPRVYIHGDIEENKILLKADPDYINKIRMAARNDAEFRAWRHGDWSIVAGGMFDDVWDTKIHFIPPFDVPHSWRIDRSFDWGSSKPFSVGWWAESDGTDVLLSGGRRRSTRKGDLYRIAEWYGWNGTPDEGLRMLAVEVAYGIVDREVRWGIHDRVKAGPADTSIYNVENGQSLAIDMAQPVRIGTRTYPGIHWTRADKTPGSRRTGWEQMRQMLKSSTKSPREEPGLFVFHTCAQFLRTVPSLPRSERDMDDADTNAEDHIADEVRYRVRSTKKRVGQAKAVMY